MGEQSCRLCMSTYHGNDHINIFSVIGIEMQMSEIISEHFKCEVSEHDSLPNIVCKSCWQTTEAFHELYEKSKTVRIKFQNSVIKIETEEDELWQSNLETHFIDESQIELGSIKEESAEDEEIDAISTKNTNIVSSVDDDEPNDNHQMDYQEDSADLEEKSEEEHANNSEEDKQNNEKNTRGLTKYDSKLQNSLTPKKNHRTSKKQFEKLFVEYKHMFDMKCDVAKCSATFETLDAARKHYATKHNNPLGYIKCCGSQLRYPSRVVQHLQRRINSDKYKCTICSNVYLKSADLKRHMKKHTEKPVKQQELIPTIPCSICMKMFTTEGVLKRHMKRHKKNDENENNYEQYEKFITESFNLHCDFCDRIFNGFEDAQQHYKDAHNDENGYIKCCNLKLNKLYLVMDHVRSHLDPTRFKCEICNKNCPSRLAFKQHLYRHRLVKEKPFACDYCEKKFSSKNLILTHLLSKHSNIESKFECDSCPKKFPSAKILKNHIYAVHRDKKPVCTCDECGRSFYTKSYLDKHMLISHTDKSVRLAQSQKCKVCGEWLMSKSGIYYHEQIHKSDPQKCPHCDIELANKMALQYHIRQYHREQKYKCSYCDKRYDIASKLKKHEESHTRHRVWNCKFCSKTFSVYGSLSTHYNRFHKEDRMRLAEMRRAHKIPSTFRDE